MSARRFIGYRIFASLVMAVALTLAAAHVARADSGAYQQTNLVSNQAGKAANLDASLVNAWGIVFNAFGPVWIADNGAGVSTVYNGAGGKLLQVTIPPAAGAASGNPTGIVFNANPNAFIIPAPTPTDPSATGPAKFIFATEDGVIAGWNSGPSAVLKVDNSPSGAVYKGLALGAGGTGARIYATDFHNSRIDVWDSSFHAVTTLPAGAFTDPKIPSGFGPFGIQNINGNLYVTYAMQDADRHDDVQGKELGYVDIYDPNGVLIDRFASKGKLNAPWGLALAPAGFGKFSNSLLVGNFGDGRINAFDVATGKFLGQLKGTDNKAIVIDGLWGLTFGNGMAPGQSVNSLFFTAGPDDESNGLYGRLDPVDEGD